MTVIGYFAMLGLGLLPLAALSRMLGTEAERVFLLPLAPALIVGFVLGFAVCLGVGRLLGLVSMGEIEAYEARAAALGSGTARRRRERMAADRRRRTGLATPAR